jgi:hypothetical protein
VSGNSPQAALVRRVHGRAVVGGMVRMGLHEAVGQRVRGDGVDGKKTTGGITRK